jgi:hypothetical protein
MKSQVAQRFRTIGILFMSLALCLVVIVGSPAEITSQAAILNTDTSGKDGVAILDETPFLGLSRVQMKGLFSGSYSRSSSLGGVTFFPLVFRSWGNLHERAALMALFNSTNGDEWFNQTGWGTTQSYCTWYGITCDTEGHVTELRLYKNHLSGSLPPEIGNLWMLTSFSIMGNEPVPFEGPAAKLTGPIPSEIGRLVNLQELDLQYNELTSLPSEIEDLVNLQKLFLGSNQIASLPPEIGNMINLRALWINNNELSYIPPEIGELSNLEHLDLSNNHISYLPPEFGNLTNLYDLWMYNNKLSSLPPEIANLSNLWNLDMGWNNLTDPVPSFLSNLSNLDLLYLNDMPNLTCWENQEALSWALSLLDYVGPVYVCESTS